MKLISCKVSNFASYKTLEFNFENQGLVLIQGATGSGKSTLEDIVPWVLFGKTAKGGLVNDVCSWNSEDDTVVRLKAVLPDGTEILVQRQRGKSNDLFWYENDDYNNVIRGKDLPDTQARLNARLGFDFELYSSSSHFNEFSDTNLFFLAKAKDRRGLFERIVSLQIPITIAERASKEKKSLKKSLDVSSNKQVSCTAEVRILRAACVDTQRLHQEYEAKTLLKLEELLNKSKDFEFEKSSKTEALHTKLFKFDEEKSKKIDMLVEKIEALSDTIKPMEYYEVRIRELQQQLIRQCSTCKQPLDRNHDASIYALKTEKLKNYQDMQNRTNLVSRLQDAQDSVNPFESLFKSVTTSSNDYWEQYEAEKSKPNPHESQLVSLKADLNKANISLQAYDLEIEAQNKRLSALITLYDLSFELRRVLIQNAVTIIQNNTNEYLEKFFESALKVEFSLPDADSIAVEVFKDGNSCSYSQLSKGQRQLLKLTFAVSIMKEVSNNAGVHFNTLFFDESLDGLDSELKAKAYRLFQSLSTEHENILVIDHDPGLKLMFDKSLSVELIAGNSEIHES